MQYVINALRAKDLVKGSFYIISRNKNGYISIGLYLGKDIRDYYCFYNVLNLRYTLVDSLYLHKNVIIDIGSEDIVNDYKVIIQYALDNYDNIYKDIVMLASTQNKILSKIELGIDTTEFISNNTVERKNKVEFVKFAEINHSDLYIVPSFEYLITDISIKESNTNNKKIYRLSTIKEYYSNKLCTRNENRYTYPKFMRVKDVLENKELNRLFKEKNKILYDYCINLYNN